VSIYSDELYHKTFHQPPKPDALYNYLTKHFPNGTYYSVYEAGYCRFWIHEKLQSLGINSIVVNPADIPTTDKMKKHKTDPVDSNKLARHLRNGNLSLCDLYTLRYLSVNEVLRGISRFERSGMKVKPGLEPGFVLLAEASHIQNVMPGASSYYYEKTNLII
jgi:hypothetical protein